jgi:hypothetical protein
VQCLKAFIQIDKGDMKPQHPTTKTLLESVTSLKDPVFAEHKVALVALRLTITWNAAWSPG